MILALDPSSSRCGYALMQAPDVLAEAGLLLPGKTRDAAIQRIPAIAYDLASLIVEAKPATILIEVSMTCHGRAGKAGAATLHVYGMAVGYLWAICEQRAPGRVCTIEANTWTKGRPKDKRIDDVARLFPQYQRGRDPGGDMADAIGIGRYWLLWERLITTKVVK